MWVNPPRFYGISGLLTAFVLLAALPSAAVHADPAAIPPTNVSSDFDGDVAPNEGAIPKRPSATTPMAAADARPHDSAMPNLTYLLERDAGLLSQRIAVILAALPTLPDELSHFCERVRESGPGGRTIGRWLLLIVISLTALAAAMAGLPRLLAGPRRGLLVGAPQPAGPAQLAGIFLLDVGVALAGVLLAYAAIEVFFSDHQLQSRVAAGLIATVAMWRLSLLPVDLLLRPGEPAARLLPFDESAAASGRRFCAVLLLVVALMVEGIGTHHDSGMPAPHVQFIDLICGLVAATMLLLGIRRARAVIAAAIAGGGSGVHTALAPHWHQLAITIVLLLLAAWFGGTLAMNLVVFQTLLGTLLILAIAWALDRFLGYLSARLFPPITAGETAGDGAALFHRCAHIGLWSLVAIALVEIWVIDLGRVIEPEQWKRLVGAILTAGITLFVAFVAWQFISFYIDRAIHNSPAATAFDPADPHTGQSPKVGTRLRTMLPLLRIALLVAVCILAVLVVLSELGVNTAPLIAGASVFGLAISFGSQALVKDVVSGIFYMADDAFRVGEYIDTGKLKGTVEGMTVRSLKLRHQNGPLHTIPFGELSSVTNYSRHFATIKFNIRLARDIDIEQVRKTVKQVGLQMMENPELHPEMIVPLKFQGIVDVDQTAVVCRLKFTCKPQKPTWVQREALKRLYEAFGRRGIQFAGPTTAQMAMPPGAVASPPPPAAVVNAPDSKSPVG